MKRVRALGGFSDYLDNEIGVVAGGVLQKMRKNPYFPYPTPTLSELMDLYEDYRVSLYKSMGGGRLNTELKREAKKKLADGLQQLSFYVNTVANGNLHMLTSSGFPIFRGNKKRHVPGVPLYVKILDGTMSGEVRATFKRVDRDVLYEYCYATTVDDRNEPVWSAPIFTTHTRNNLISGLVPGSKVYVKVRARNGHGVGDWSNYVSLIVR